jgi:hypothetical protein
VIEKIRRVSSLSHKFLKESVANNSILMNSKNFIHLEKKRDKKSKIGFPFLLCLKKVRMRERERMMKE